jgi:hypothetical protein
MLLGADSGSEGRELGRGPSPRVSLNMPVGRRHLLLNAYRRVALFGVEGRSHTVGVWEDGPEWEQ